MEYLIQLIDSLWQDPEYTRGVILVLFALTAIVGTISIALIITGLMNPIQKRLNAIAKEKGNKHRTQSSLQKISVSVQPLTMPKEKKDKHETQQSLIQAGYRAKNTLATFYAIKMLFGLLFPALVLMGATFYSHYSTTEVLFTTLLAAFIGLRLPNIVLQHQRKKRQLTILHAFPDALDLLVSCTEAGLGLNSALQRVANELDISCPELAEELSQVNAEIRAGVDRVKATRGLYERTGLEDIRGLVSLFSQTMRYGTSIADALRIYAEEFRDKRIQKAEEQAAMLGTKLIFPMVLCIFPAFFVIAIGPAVIAIIDVFQNMGGS